MFFGLFVVAPLAIAILTVLRSFLNTEELFFVDVSAVGGYITTIGTFYGILTAFIIFVVWDQFNKTASSIEKEAKDLQDLIVYVSYMGDPKADRAIRTAVSEYAKYVVSEEWKELRDEELNCPVTEEKFRNIVGVIDKIELNDAKDPIAWEHVIQKYEDISDTRQERRSLSVERVPTMMRILLYLVSLGVLAGFFLLGIKNDFIATVITSFSTFTLVLVIQVINDIDNPFTGRWAVTPKPFKKLIL